MRLEKSKNYETKPRARGAEDRAEGRVESRGEAEEFGVPALRVVADLRLPIGRAEKGKGKRRAASGS